VAESRQGGHDRAKVVGSVRRLGTGDACEKGGGGMDHRWATQGEGGMTGQVGQLEENLGFGPRP
jgi:hypothetical protein